MILVNINLKIRRKNCEGREMREKGKEKQMEDIVKIPPEIIDSYMTDNLSKEIRGIIISFGYPTEKKLEEALTRFVEERERKARIEELQNLPFNGDDNSDRGFMRYLLLLIFICGCATSPEMIEPPLVSYCKSQARNTKFENDLEACEYYFVCNGGDAVNAKKVCRNYVELKKEGEK